MQRLFSMFPNAVPGVGLLLLRAAVAASLAGSPSPPWLAWPLMLSITAGLATPILAAVAALLHASLLVMSPSHAPAAFVPAVTALALALLGPGAYSIDARRFGRRLVVTSTPSDTNE